MLVLEKVAATAQMQVVSKGGDPFAAAHPLLNRNQAAVILGVRPQTLAAWASNRRVDIPFVKIGRRVMYRHKDLDAFIAANIKGVAAKKEVLQ